MTSYLYTTAYPYALKKPAGPFYYLRVHSMGCLNIDGVIARIAATAVPVLDTGPPGKRDPPPHAKLINAV